MIFRMDKWLLSLTLYFRLQLYSRPSWKRALKFRDPEYNQQVWAVAAEPCEPTCTQLHVPTLSTDTILPFLHINKYKICLFHQVCQCWAVPPMILFLPSSILQ